MLLERISYIRVKIIESDMKKLKSVETWSFELFLEVMCDWLTTFVAVC